MRPVAALAPHAGFLLVALADGELQSDAVDAFAERLSACEDPVIRRLVAAGTGDVDERMARLVANQELIVASLAAAGEVLRAEGDQGDAKAELMRLIGGSGSAPAAAAAGRVGRLLDGTPEPGTALRAGLALAAMVAVPTLVVVVGIGWCWG